MVSAKLRALILLAFAAAACALSSRGGRCESCRAIDLRALGHDRPAGAGR